MQTVIEYWHWLIAGVTLLGLEALAPIGIFLWLGLAAVALALVGALWPTMDFRLQLILYGFVALGVTLICRHYFRHPTESDKPLLNQRGRSYIGRCFVLIRAIENGVGEIRVDDSTWRVRGADCPIDAVVEVVGADGTELLVRPKTTA
jgi:hypothetical protein